MLAERRRQRAAVTPSKVTVKYVECTPEEMEYDAPADVSDPKRFPVIARNRREWLQFLSFRRGYVRLEPDLREVFPDAESVNNALRKLIEAFPRSGKRKKSA